MPKGSEVLISDSSDVLICGLVQASAARTAEARQRAVSLCEQAAAALGVTERAIAACKRTAAAQVAARPR